MSPKEVAPRNHVEAFKRKLVQDSTASFAVFEPVDGIRDKFGNRAFPHPHLAYYDRVGTLMRAALLVTPQGQEFLKTNRGILKSIENGLSQLHKEEHFRGDFFFLPTIGKQTVELNKRGDRTLTYLDEGGQSTVYKLETSTGAYVVEVKNPRADRLDKDDDATQPYVNEMLQVQSLQQDMGDVLARAGVVTAKYLFASPVMSCQVYEEGAYPTEMERRNLFDKLYSPVKRYLAQKRASKKPLWENITLDMKIRDFLKKADGSFVWIDCFAYQPPLPKVEPVRVFVPKTK